MTDDKSLIEQANAAASRLEEANKVNAELIARQEAIDARRILGGQTEAGTPKAPEMSEEDKLKADLKNFFKGSALEEVL